jgi:TolB protein
MFHTGETCISALLRRSARATLGFLTVLLACAEKTIAPTTGDPRGDPLLIAFASNRVSESDSSVGSLYDVYTVTPDGAQIRRVTQSWRRENGLSWSPDHSRLAYLQMGADGSYSSSEVHLVNADGTGDVVLLSRSPQGGYYMAVSWSPDGARLAVVENAVPGYPGAHVVIWTIDGANRTQVTDSTISAYSPAWSPDGSMLAFAGHCQQCPARMARNLYLIRPDGSDLRQLTFGTDLSDDRDGPTWSPDGSRLAFAHDSAFTSAIEVMNVNDGSSVTVTRCQRLNGCSSPTWSPDGTRLAFLEFLGGLTGNLDILLVNTDGTDLRTLVSGPDRVSALSWTR